MRSSRLNEWLQILASLGVLAGLLLVAFQIRESNRVATAEAVQGLDMCFVQLFVSEYESDIAHLIVRSIEEPVQLSASEKWQLGSWLTAVISCYQDWLNMNQLGVARYDGLEDLRESVDHYMSSEFGRAWFAENKSWMYPEMARIIETELAAIPVRVDPPGIAGWSPAE